MQLDMRFATREGSKSGAVQGTLAHVRMDAVGSGPPKFSWLGFPYSCPFLARTQ